MPAHEFTPVRELRDVTPEQFRDEILPAQIPVVMRGAVGDWPAVKAGRESPQAMVDYLKGFDVGASAEAMLGPASIGGHFFYNADITGLNFERQPRPIAELLQRLLALPDAPDAEALYVGALPTAAGLPGFTRDNVLSLLNPAIVPRVWFCNRVTVQTHFDMSNNIACVVAGRRRFTLFPPEQVANLYIGPLEFTLAGQPISMVKLADPDFERYPRFRDALAAAQVAELEPGDALFVPYMWWHNVETRERFNVLVNYWWDETPAWRGSPFEALVHAVLAIKSLPPAKLHAWQAFFEHYIFQEGDPVAHLGARQRGLLAPASPQMAELLKAKLVQALSRKR